jgi:hypothetical protein
MKIKTYEEAEFLARRFSGEWKLPRQAGMSTVAAEAAYRMDIVERKSEPKKSGGFRYFYRRTK